MSKADAPSSRFLMTSIWADGSMLVWGGYSAVKHDDGARYFANDCDNSPPVAVAGGNQVIECGSSSVVDGGGSFDPATVGRLTSVTSFDSTAPYLGFGFDFEVFGKAGLNLDFGVLWQGDPSVTLEATNWDNLSTIEQALLGPALAAEQAELEDDISDYKAWPVVSLAFVYNF